MTTSNQRDVCLMYPPLELCGLDWQKVTTRKQIDDAVGMLRARGLDVHYAVRNGIVWVMVDERWFTYSEVCEMAGIATQQSTILES